MFSDIMHSLYHALMTLGGFVCHQMPERSPQLWHVQMPLCWRCSGILLGTLVLVVSTTARRKLPPLRLSLALAWLMPLDATGTILGLWKGVNAMRFITGVVWGVFGASAILQIAIRSRWNWLKRHVAKAAKTSLAPLTPSK